MPPKYEKWLPKFTGTDATSAEEHMSNFWAFFSFTPSVMMLKTWSGSYSLLLFMMPQGVGTSAFLMEASRPWIDLKRPFSKDGVSKKTLTCCSVD
jgi:hypothetical protein